MRTESCERSAAPSSSRGFPQPARSPAAPRWEPPVLGRLRLAQPRNETSRSSHSPGQKRSRSRKQERRGGRRGTPAGAASASWAGCGAARVGRRRAAGGTRPTFLLLQRRTRREVRSQQCQERGSHRPGGSHRCPQALAPGLRSQSGPRRAAVRGDTGLGWTRR